MRQGRFAVGSAFSQTMDGFNNNVSRIEAARQYLVAGFSVIPIRPKDKRPLVEWKEFQTRFATLEEIERWWPEESDANIAIVTGEISKIVVVDIDPIHGGNESAKGLHLPPTYIVRTGSGGTHYYFRWPHQLPPPNKKGYLPGIDLQGTAAYVVAPPSVHPNGNAYEAVTTLDELTDAPEWLCGLQEITKEKLWETSVDGAAVGKRNEAASSICGRVLATLPQKLWESFGWAGLVEWNKNNKPPLPENELRSVFDSIAKREAKDHSDDDEESRAASIAKQIVELIMKSEPTLVHDELDAPYARIMVDNHHEVHALGSQRFRQWATRLFYLETKKPAKSEHVKQALDLLGSLALFEGEKVKLANRVAEHEGSFWYDLCDEEWRAVKVSGAGWELVENPPTIFARQKHQMPQCLPMPGGSLSRLLEFVNIADEQQRLLFQVYLVSCFIANIPHPIPVLFGSQGSAKSTFMRIIRRLVDPSAIELLTFPTRKEELVQQLSHHWAPFYDNIGTIVDWLSDSLCRAVTGEGFSKRELYTNNEDVIYNFRCCIGLNGINIAATKADLLDRSILFGLERIKPEQRRDEQTFWSDFERERPIILGAIFDALSKAIAIRPTIRVDQLPRMADFCLWGCAIAEALGMKQEDFLAAYRANIERQNQEALNEHPVATAILALMKTQDEWFGTPTELLGVLVNLAEKERINVHQKTWPKAPHVLTRRLNEVKTNLEAIGLGIIVKSIGTHRTVRIVRSKNSVSSAEASGYDGTDAADSISEANQQAQATLDLIREHLDPNAKFADEK